jgi:hypothetical protein
MSLYFEGFFTCSLKPDTPDDVIQVLHYMTRSQEAVFDGRVPDHRFFSTDHWRQFLHDIPDYGFISGLKGVVLQKETQFVDRAYVDVYALSFRRGMHDDVEFYVLWWDFLFWIAPYSVRDSFVGYYREQYALHPVLIYFLGGEVHWLRHDMSQPERLEYPS